MNKLQAELAFLEQVRKNRDSQRQTDAANTPLLARPVRNAMLDEIGDRIIGTIRSRAKVGIYGFDPEYEVEMVLRLIEVMRDDSDMNTPRAAAQGLDVERLAEFALTARRMVEDGHPDDPEWFSIITLALHNIEDLLDARLATSASPEAEGLPDHDCLMPSACGVTGFYCANSQRQPATICGFSDTDVNRVSYGFRDDVTDEELDRLLDANIVFECDDHGVLEITGEGDLDQAIGAIRSGQPIYEGEPS